ncbi:MAG: hypothetical protein R3B49_10745 [Phycisphaerales bacterium]
MNQKFFEKPVLNSPYDFPARHWELDKDGQPTGQIIESRRKAEFITPIPKPKKRGKSASQQEIVFDEGKGLSTAAQQYDPTGNIAEIRRQVDRWRADRGKGDQPPRGRGDEGVPGGLSKAELEASATYKRVPPAHWGTKPTQEQLLQQPQSPLSGTALRAIRRKCGTHGRHGSGGGCHGPTSKEGC